MEAQILRMFLLSRASLNDIISPRDFAELFPRDKRTHPQVKLLYRELQLARTRQCNQVKANIAREARVGPRPATRTRELDQDAMVGIELYGAGVEAQMLSLPELLEEMQMAVDEQNTEQAALDEECDTILEQIKTIVGDLSDLRYGKLADPNTSEQVRREVTNLENVCRRVTNTSPD